MTSTGTATTTTATQPSSPSAAAATTSSHETGVGRKGNSSNEEEGEGGPLWRAAQEEAARRMEPLQVMPNSSEQQPGRISRFRAALAKKKAALSHSLKAKTRSRAFVDDLPAATESGSISTANNPNDQGDVPSQQQVPPSSSSSSAMMPSTRNVVMTGAASKRVKVVQLLVFGMMGVIGGFFGSVFCQSSCHFATATVDLDVYSEVEDEYTVSQMDLHYGMWKYTPLDSAYHQYAYCDAYEEVEGDGTDTPPVVARSLGLVALLGGTLALMVLWTYLLSGYTTDILWKLAMVLLLLAAVSQGLTFTLFATQLCQVYSCSVGPAAVASMVATLLWLATAYEMYRNAPPSSVILATTAALRLQRDEWNLWEFGCCCCCCRNYREARYTQTMLTRALWDYYQHWWSGSTAHTAGVAPTTAEYANGRPATPERDTPNFSQYTPPSTASGRYTPSSSTGRHAPSSTGRFTPSPSPSLSAMAKRLQLGVVRKQQEFAQKRQEEGGAPEPFQYQPPNLEAEQET